MNVSIIANQMMVLFLMMVAGYGAYKRGMVSREGTKSLSSLIVNILNPCLILSGVMNKEVTYGPRLILENLLLVFLMFALLIVLSLLLSLIHILSNGPGHEVKEIAPGETPLAVMPANEMCIRDRVCIIPTRDFDKIEITGKE